MPRQTRQPRGITRMRQRFAGGTARMDLTVRWHALGQFAASAATPRPTFGSC